MLLLLGVTQVVRDLGARLDRMDEWALAQSLFEKLSSARGPRPNRQLLIYATAGAAVGPKIVNRVLRHTLLLTAPISDFLTAWREGGQVEGAAVLTVRSTRRRTHCQLLNFKLDGHKLNIDY